MKYEKELVSAPGEGKCLVLNEDLTVTTIEFQRDKETYSKDEVLDIVRQVLFYGEPEYWEKGGITGVINYPRNGTYKKAQEYFEKFYLKRTPKTV